MGRLMGRSWRRGRSAWWFVTGESWKNHMIQAKKQNTETATEPENGRPAGTGEEWLGRNRSSKRRLWERLNPRSRKQIHVIAQALALQQTHAQLPEPLRARLSAAVEELERHVARLRALLAEVARRTPRGE